MMIHTFLFKRTSFCLEIPLKLLKESKEICMKKSSELFSVFQVSVQWQTWQDWQDDTCSPIGHLWAGELMLQCSELEGFVEATGRKSVFPLRAWM